MTPDENTNIDTPEVETPQVETPTEETPVETPADVPAEEPVATPEEPTPEPVAEETPSAPTATVFEGELDLPELQANAGAKPLDKAGLTAYIENLKIEHPEKYERRKDELEKKLAALE